MKIRYENIEKIHHRELGENSQILDDSYQVFYLATEELAVLLYLEYATFRLH